MVVKATGVCLLTQLTADTCRDAGETALAGKAELAGRFVLLALAVPLFADVLELVTALINGQAVSRMRRLCGTLLCAALLWLLCLPAAAAPAESTESAKSAKPADTAQLYAQQLSASGGDALTERLPADARALLEELQVDVSRPESFTGLSAMRCCRC